MFKNDLYMGSTWIDSIAIKSPRHLQMLLRSFFDWRSCGNCGLVPVGHSKLPPINLGNANTNVNTGMFKNDLYTLHGHYLNDSIAVKSPKHLHLILRSFFGSRSCGNCGLVPVGHSKLPPINLGNANTNVNTGMFKNDLYTLHGHYLNDSIAVKSPKHLHLILRSFFGSRSCGNCGLVPVGHSKLPPINLGNANTNVNTGMFKNDVYVTWALPEWQHCIQITEAPPSDPEELLRLAQLWELWPGSSGAV